MVRAVSGLIRLSTFCILFPLCPGRLRAEGVAYSHLRSTDPSLIDAVREGMEGSAAHVVLMGHGGGRRYLRLSIDPRYVGCARIALLGHELRHAVEIASDPSVNTDSMLIDLFGRIGFASCGRHACFETEAAIETGRQIRNELARASTR